MAIRLEDTYPASRITPADADYPAGSLKNETTPGVSNDGTPLDSDWGNDFEGLKQAVLRLSSVSGSGSPETALASQILQGLVELASGRAFTYDESGVANAYVFDLRTNQQGPAALFDGMIAIAEVGSANTGACTVNVNSFGIKSIKLPDGTDPNAGDVDGRTELVYDLANDRFNLILGGTGATVTSSGSNANGNWRVWSDGFIEQWGKIAVNQSLISNTLISAALPFPIAFASSVDSTVFGWTDATVNLARVSFGLVSQSLTLLGSLYGSDNGSGGTRTGDFNWYARGF